MSTDRLAFLFSFLFPAMASLALFRAVAAGLGFNPNGGRWFAGLGLLAVAVVAVPVNGLPLARWAAGVSACYSLPLHALLAAHLGRQFFNLELLRPADARAVWGFGAVTGLALYPAALGLGNLDPYTMGWQFGPLFVIVGAFVVFWIWRQNRLGHVLVLSAAAWHVQLLESDNYWDYLVDPLFFLLAVGMVCQSLAARRWRLPNLPTHPLSSSHEATPESS